MARTRNVPPKFWEDRDLAKGTSLAGRLLYLGLRAQADHYGRLPGDPAWVKGKVFPYDNDIDLAAAGQMLKELDALGRVLRYEVDGKPYLVLPCIARHNPPAGTKPSEFPPPPPGLCPEEPEGRPRDLNAGRDDVRRICDHLASRVESHGNLRPRINKTDWLDPARLLLDTDGRSEDQVHKAIEWCQGNDFWRRNIRTVSKLRHHYDRLRQDAEAERRRQSAGGLATVTRLPTTDQRRLAVEELKRKRRQQESGITGTVVQGELISGL
jgi:hypothetical protein